MPHPYLVGHNIHNNPFVQCWVRKKTNRNTLLSIWRQNTNTNLWQVRDKCIILDQECKSQFPYQSFHSMSRLDKISADVGNIKSSMLMNGWLKCWSQNVYLHYKNLYQVMV